ncbi:SDR family NAD(P)-dependent oxidoreductase [Rhodococcus sp. NPDC127528]|uniref:SDR family NAD(P)-dependent oxidoreductase n=1 Tax=unclassified Rhodococcus (in: high G+C Gram-positive bacteria) TaxID=192944 RepID=UPI00362BA7EC
MTTATKTWFITGSSRGSGRALATRALERGDRVAATARRPEQLNDLVERFGDRALPLPLDVTDAAAAGPALKAARDAFGPLDVIVNNAGYANVAPVETGSEEDFRRQFETNFWGVYNVSRAAVPLLKAQGSGTIVQFSSIGGRVGGTLGLGSYQAAKFAIDGLTRVLAAETAPFGLRYLTVEPSGFATDWAGSSMGTAEIPDDYRPAFDAFTALVRSGKPAGDPDRAADILVRLIHQGELPTHLPLGADAVDMAVRYSEQQIAEVDRWRAVSSSADFAAPYPAEFPDMDA